MTRHFDDLPIVRRLREENERLRSLNVKLMAKIAAASEVLGLVAERGQVSDAAVALIVGECQEVAKRHGG